MTCKMCNDKCPCGPCGLDGPIGERGEQGPQGITGSDGKEISAFGTIYHMGWFETQTDQEIPMNLYSCCYDNVNFPYNSNDKTIKLQVEIEGCYLITYDTSASTDLDYCLFVESTISGPIEESYFTGTPCSSISHTFLANLQAGETLCLKVGKNSISISQNNICHITANLSVTRIGAYN